eukprot:jgi/Undpi1/13815/HiC_scaffold_9.g03466.m1
MRTFVAATCAAFLALAPGAIATTREDIEERKRAHTEMLENIGHDMHRHLRDLDEDGLSPHMASGAMRKMRRDRFEKDGAAREHRRPEREMPDASEMHRIAQDFAEQHRKRASDVHMDHQAAQELLRAHTSQQSLTGRGGDAGDRRAHFAEKTKKMQAAARDFAHGLDADGGRNGGGGRGRKPSATGGDKLAGRSFDHDALQNLGNAGRRVEEPVDFEDLVEDVSIPGNEGGD